MYAPSVRIDVQNIRVVKVLVPVLLSGVIMSLIKTNYPENNYRHFPQSGRMAPSGTWRHSFDQGRRPLPFSLFVILAFYYLFLLLLTSDLFTVNSLFDYYSNSLSA